MVHWCHRILQLNQNFVNLFYKKTGYDPRISILKQEFCEVFDLIKEQPFITIIPEIVQGFKHNFLNCEKQLYSQEFGRSSRSLSIIQHEKIKKTTSKKFNLGLTEIDNCNEFFEEEILGQSSEQVLRVYEKLLKNIKYTELRNLLIHKITQFKANNLEFFQCLVSNIVTKTTFEKKLEFLFDIFSNFQEEMA